MKTRKASPAIQFIHRHWIPLIGIVTLTFLCYNNSFTITRALASKLSGDYNKLFIAVSVVMLLWLACNRHKWRGLRQVVEVVLLPLIVTHGLKFLLPLPRPPRMSHSGLPLSDGFSPGFPSSHTAFAFALAWLVSQYKPALAPWWYGVAVAIGWSRVGVAAHYPYQVICGAVVGLLLGYWVSQSPRGILQSLRSFFSRQTAARRYTLKTLQD